MLLFLKKYCSILEKDPESFGLKVQSYSHILLMKLIISIMAFEILKRENKDTENCLSHFRISLNIKDMYLNFNTISYKARSSMEAILKYWKNNCEK